jgi:hypothetical protein
LIVLKDRAGTGEDPMVIGNDHTKVVERATSGRSWSATRAPAFVNTS